MRRVVAGCLLIIVMASCSDEISAPATPKPAGDLCVVGSAQEKTNGATSIQTVYRAYDSCSGSGSQQALLDALNVQLGGLGYERVDDRAVKPDGVFAAAAERFTKGNAHLIVIDAVTYRSAQSSSPVDDVLQRGLFPEGKSLSPSAVVLVVSAREGLFELAS